MNITATERPRWRMWSEELSATGGKLMRNSRPVVLPVLLAGSVSLLWELIVWFYQIPHVILPPPTEILGVLVDAWPIILTHSVPTALESAYSFLIALSSGVILALAITYSQLVRETVYPNLVVFQLIPKVALAPLFIIWFGIQSEMRLAFSAFISFFPILIATATGLSNASPDMLRLGRSLTASNWQIFLTIRFPFALPYIFSGMKIAMTFAIIGVIVGEFITSQRGLGYLILLASSKAETGLIFAALAVLSIVGLSLYGIVAAGEWLVNKRYKMN